MVGGTDLEPAGDASINVKSLRMRFEKTDSSPEGLSADRHLSVEVPTKASESIKKFESLAKKDPGLKASDGLDRSLSKSSSTKGSLRVGNLRDKFESLANRSLSSELFNGAGESNEDQQLSCNATTTPLLDGPQSESESLQMASIKTEAEVSTTRRESEGVSIKRASSDAPTAGPISSTDLVADSFDAAEDMSSCTISSEDSCQDREPVLCLKDQIEIAQASEMRSDHPQEYPESGVVTTNTVKDETVSEDPSPQSDDRLDKSHSLVNQAETVDKLDDVPTILEPTDQSSTPVDAAPVKETQQNESVPDESSSGIEENNANEALLPAEVEADANGRVGSLCDSEVEHEQIPIERRQFTEHKRRGFLHRLLMCGGTAV